MGLKSLPMLNKSQIGQYWQHVWNSNLLYKSYFSLSMHSYDLIGYLFNSKKFITINKHIRLNYKTVYFMFKKKKKKKFYYVGRIWLMRYSNTIIIYTRFYSELTKVWGYSQPQNKNMLFRYVASNSTNNIKYSMKYKYN